MPIASPFWLAPARQPVVFALLDCSVALFFILPLFGQRTGESVAAVSLLGLAWQPLYIKGIYLVLALLTVLWGVAALALQNHHGVIWARCQVPVSLLLNLVGTLSLILSQQPYAAIFTLALLLAKGILSINRH